MYTKSRQKKCRHTPVLIESKLAPLPNIGNVSSRVANVSSIRARHSSKNGVRGNHHMGRSGSVTDREGLLVRRRKVVSEKEKTTSTKSIESPKYKTFGRSSDPSFEDPSRKHQFPDLCTDLSTSMDGSVVLDPKAPWWLFLAEMRMQAKRQAVILDSKPDTLTVFSARMDDKVDGSMDVKVDGVEVRKVGTKVEGRPDTNDEERARGRQSKKHEDETKYAFESDRSPNRGNAELTTKEHNSEDDTKGKEDTAGEDFIDNDEDDDEEEDESGLPQAVRAMQSQPTIPNAREVIREQHKVMMEEIARTVSRRNLISHLQAEGFFTYDYSQHTRTNMTNLNLRRGKKKGIERLLTLLACKTSKNTGELYGTT